MNRSERLFLLAFFLLNLLQATFTQLTGDEALYWMYWQELDWGFRDHPPAIGVMIGIGYSLLKSELGVRFFVVIASTLTAWLIWKLAKPAKWWHGALLLFALPALNLYGFIATPDVPLLLTTALYLTVWKGFVEKQTLRNAFMLGLCMAAMMWSKYHGILVIVFTILPLYKLWFNRFFWIAASIGVALYAPHLIWQVQHDLPTIKFHINERNSDAWEWKNILGYVGGQFVLFNPVVFVLCISLLIREKAADDFEKSLRWFIGGMLLLFFLNSFRGRVEMHWTAPLAIAIIVLICKKWSASPPAKPVVFGLGVFISALIFIRIALIFDFVPRLHKDFHRNKNKMLALKNIAQDLPVCFMNSYQNPSLYMFYCGGIAHSINNAEGGKNRYDYWTYNEAIDHKPFLFSASYEAPGFEKVKSDQFTFDVKRHDDLPVLHQLVIWSDDWLHHAYFGDTLRIDAWLINKNHYGIQLNDRIHPIQWRAMMNHKKWNEANMDVVIKDKPGYISSLDSARVSLSFIIPDRPGKNLMYFASQVDQLPCTYQSNRMRIMIDKKP